MKKIIVLTLLMMMMGVSVFAASDWDEYESGRNNIRLEGYQGQPGYICFEDGDGNVLGYIYWNEIADELYVATEDEFNKSYKLGEVNSAITTNIGVPLSTYAGDGDVQ